MSTIAAHQAAVVAAINAAGGSGFTIAGLAELAQKPAHYCEVSVLQKPSEAVRYGGISDTTQWTVLVRAVAMDWDNAVAERQKAHDALDDRFLTIDAVDTTHLTLSVTDDDIGPDDGWFSGLSEWSYGH